MLFGGTCQRLAIARGFQAVVGVDKDEFSSFHGPQHLPKPRLPGRRTLLRCAVDWNRFTGKFDVETGQCCFQRADVASPGIHGSPQMVEERWIQTPPTRRVVQVIHMLSIVGVGLFGMQPPSRANPCPRRKPSDDGDLDVVPNVANKAVLHVCLFLNKEVLFEQGKRLAEDQSPPWRWPPREHRSSVGLRADCPIQPCSRASAKADLKGES
jgi:hypothetical protein